MASAKRVSGRTRAVSSDRPTTAGARHLGDHPTACGGEALPGSSPSSPNASGRCPRAGGDRAGPPQPAEALTYQSTATYLLSVKASSPSVPPSRPSPLSFTPPNGAAGSDTSPRLRPTMPASIRSLTRRPRARSAV